eukprot:scaffold1522_cov166-Amphora_coffeaeformis.AAC.29
MMMIDMTARFGTRVRPRILVVSSTGAPSFTSDIRSKIFWAVLLRKTKKLATLLRPERESGVTVRHSGYDEFSHQIFVQNSGNQFRSPLMLEPSCCTVWSRHWMCIWGVSFSPNEHDRPGMAQYKAGISYRSIAI